MFFISCVPDENKWLSLNRYLHVIGSVSKPPSVPSSTFRRWASANICVTTSPTSTSIRTYRWDDSVILKVTQIDGLMQERRNSVANTLRLSCIINPSRCTLHNMWICHFMCHNQTTLGWFWSSSGTLWHLVGPIMPPWSLQSVWNFFINSSDAGDRIFRLWVSIPCLLMHWLL